jgi:hypothetical protein
MNEEKHSHPSFGQILFSRVSGHANFYGSELEQDHYIQLTVKRSEIIRDLTMDKYYSGLTPVIKLRISSGQFAELITSMNRGEGVCCTIEQVEGKKVAELPTQESRKEFIHRTFQDRMKEFGDKLRDRQSKAAELVKKKTLSKEDQHDLNLHLEWLTQEIESNIPFFAKQFQETVDQVVFEAKTEVENAIQHKVNMLGLEALHEQNKLFSDKGTSA